MIAGIRRSSRNSAIVALCWLAVATAARGQDLQLPPLGATLPATAAQQRPVSYGITLASLWDSNVVFLDTEGPSDWISTLRLDGRLLSRTARRTASADGYLSGALYRDLSERDRIDAGARVDLEARPSTQTNFGLIAAADLNHTDTLPVLSTQVVLLPLARTHSYGVTALAQTRLSNGGFDATASFQGLSFDDPALVGDRSFGASAAWYRTLGSHARFRLEYQNRTTRYDDGHRGGSNAAVGSFPRQLTNHVSAFAAAGPQRSSDSTSTTAQWGLALRAGLALRTKRLSMTLDYNHGVSDTPGVGSDRSSDQFGAALNGTLGKRTVCALSASESHDRLNSATSSTATVSRELKANLTQGFGRQLYVAPFVGYRRRDRAADRVSAFRAGVLLGYGQLQP